MSINNIALSDLLVTEWYRPSTLVPGDKPAQSPAPTPAITTPAPTETPAAPSQDYKYLGKNNKKISILVDSHNSAFLPDDQLNFLSKILEACRMNLGDVAILNHHTTPIAINTLRQQLQPQHIILFGIEPTAIRLPINFPEFRPQPYDQCTYLSAPPLKDLVPNTADAKLLKSKLWVCLKTLFEV